MSKKTKTIKRVVFHVNVSSPVPVFSTKCLFSTVSFNGATPDYRYTPKENKKESS